MDMPPLVIGSRTARLPIVQGGMAVRISLSPLAAAVARAGGVGIIAGSGLTPAELAAEVRVLRRARWYAPIELDAAGVFAHQAVGRAMDGGPAVATESTKRTIRRCVPC